MIYTVIVKKLIAVIPYLFAITWLSFFVVYYAPGESTAMIALSYKVPDSFINEEQAEQYVADLEMAEEISDSLAVMHGGHIYEMGATQELFRHPVHPYFKNLLASLPSRGMKAFDGFPLLNEHLQEILYYDNVQSTRVEITHNHFVRCALC